MSKAMPKSVSILLAVYNPKIYWLCELLDSINRQTYPNIRLFVRDDASTQIKPEELELLLKEHVNTVPYQFARNEYNIGSNKTFEALIRDADGDYVSFCDQDDIWLPEKVAETVRLYENSTLFPKAVCTDMKVIDGEGKEIASSMTEHRPHHKFLRGNDLAEKLIYRNFAVGCTLLMERTRALNYLPIPDDVVHDHYLAFRASLDGAIDYLPTPLLLYRVHGDNQTGVMTGVETKEDYLWKRIRVFENRVKCFSRYAGLAELDVARKWAEARLANYKREKGGFKRLWTMRTVNKGATYFDLFVLRSPNFVFRFVIQKLKQGKL